MTQITQTNQDNSKQNTDTSLSNYVSSHKVALAFLTIAGASAVKFVYYDKPTYSYNTKMAILGVGIHDKSFRDHASKYFEGIKSILEHISDDNNYDISGLYLLENIDRVQDWTNGFFDCKAALFTEALKTANDALFYEPIKIATFAISGTVAALYTDSEILHGLKNSIDAVAEFIGADTCTAAG